MSNMNYNVGDILRVDGDDFRVLGKIVFDGMWVEYRLLSQVGNQERWLSIDEQYREYSISRKADHSVSFAGYHVVDEGTERVVHAEGNVDVEDGDSAIFTEYEDVTTEKIISVERWDDEEEISVGYYLDAHEIVLLSSRYGNTSGASPYVQRSVYDSGHRSSGNKSGLWIGVTVLVMIIGMLGSVLRGSSGGNKIAKYIENSQSYVYETSITGADSQKADVYYTTFSVDQAARDVINGIKGDTEDVQQNTEDGDSSITILTNKEYCIIYTSEDNITLVQVSDREYAYRNDNDLYRGNRYTNRYYRRYYYSRGYGSDTVTYDDYSSPYSSYTDSTLSGDYDSTYNTYSSSIRQSSTTSRTSSGGGLSSGK